MTISNPAQENGILASPEDTDHALFSAATGDALEFESLRALLVHRAATDLGAQRWQERLPCQDEEELRRRRELQSEAERLITAQALIPTVDRPLRPILGALKGSAYELDGKDLVRLGDMLEISAAANHRIAQADPACPALQELVADLDPFAELRRALRQTFDERGEIREDATPRLAELRKKIRKTRNNVYQQLGQQVERFREHLSEETIPLRDGRLVLMLQSGARGKIPGLVHGRSSSGRSFYFEPLDAVELNNGLQQSIDEEAIEKRRILNDLISRARQALPELEAHAACLAEIDALQAAARFGQLCGGTLADLGEQHEVRLIEARHPLLDPRLQNLRREALGQPGHGDSIIPLDIELSAERRALVVTGPNAGGKTVALKTVGLLALAHQFGLPIPVAKGSRMPFFSHVIATVGDDQDLLADRSTFSGRLIRLREAWLTADEDSLILLDELGSGTDPEEGAALSVSLLEGLLDRRSLMLVTTHLSQVAAAALEADGAFCASMQFDSASGQPTYTLLPGPPGGSEAIALARRLGLPAPWLERAETLLGSEHRTLRRLLAEVERARDELTATRARLQTELDDAAILRKRLAAKEAEVNTERKTIGKRLENEMRAFRDATLRKLSEEMARMRQEFQGGRRKSLPQEAVERLFDDAPQFVEASDIPDGPVAVGMQVRHRRMGWTGKLEQLDRGRCQVRVKGKLLRCDASELVPAQAEEGAPKPSRTARTTPATSAKAKPLKDESTSKELNLIGQRVEPALEQLDLFLDRALLAGQPEVRIIHGHGTGRLRSAVREFVRSHRGVAGHRPGKPNEGGNGATIAELSDH